MCSISYIGVRNGNITTEKRRESVMKICTKFLFTYQKSNTISAKFLDSLVFPFNSKEGIKVMLTNSYPYNTSKSKSLKIWTAEMVKWLRVFAAYRRPKDSAHYLVLNGS